MRVRMGIVVLLGLCASVGWAGDFPDLEEQIDYKDGKFQTNILSGTAEHWAREFHGDSFAARIGSVTELLSAFETTFGRSRTSVLDVTTEANIALGTFGTMKTEVASVSGDITMADDKKIGTASTYMLVDHGNDISTMSKFGVGTITPNALIEVNEAARAMPSTTGNATGQVFRVRASSDKVLDFGVMSESPWGSWMQSRAHSTSADAVLLLNPNGGNVGIGTLLPSTALEINGALAIQGDVTATVDTLVDIAHAGDANAFKFIQTGNHTAVHDTFTVEDKDDTAGGQDEGSVLRLLKSNDISTGANGYSLIDLTYTGTLGGYSTYWLLARRVDKATPSWGIDTKYSDYWTTGSIYGGATAYDAAGVGSGASLFNSATFKLAQSGVSYINGGNVGIGQAAPAIKLSVNGKAAVNANAVSATAVFRADGIIEAEDTYLWSSLLRDGEPYKTDARSLTPDDREEIVQELVSLPIAFHRTVLSSRESLGVIATGQSGRITDGGGIYTKSYLGALHVGFQEERKQNQKQDAVDIELAQADADHQDRIAYVEGQINGVNGVKGLIAQVNELKARVNLLEHLQLE